MYILSLAVVKWVTSVCAVIADTYIYGRERQFMLTTIYADDNSCNMYCRRRQFMQATIYAVTALQICTTSCFTLVHNQLREMIENNFPKLIYLFYLHSSFTSITSEGIAVTCLHSSLNFRIRGQNEHIQNLGHLIHVRSTDLFLLIIFQLITFIILPTSTCMGQ